MPAGLARIDPPAEHPNASRAYTLTENGQHLGTVVLVLTQRPHGATIRRDWWPILPPDDTSPRFQRPFPTRSAALQTLRYRHALRTRPTPLPPPDATLGAITAARDNAGPAAAIWLAAAVTVHHLTELETNRTANPPALWREVHRVITWITAATTHETIPLPDREIHYRRTFDVPEIGQ